MESKIYNCYFNMYQPEIDDIQCTIATNFGQRDKIYTSFENPSNLCVMIKADSVQEAKEKALNIFKNTLFSTLNKLDKIELDYLYFAVVHFGSNYIVTEKRVDNGCCVINKCNYNNADALYTYVTAKNEEEAEIKAAQVFSDYYKLQAENLEEKYNKQNARTWV